LVIDGIRQASHILHDVQPYVQPLQLLPLLELPPKQTLGMRMLWMRKLLRLLELLSHRQSS
jgi:hypothetical protein